MLVPCVFYKTLEYMTSDYGELRRRWSRIFDSQMWIWSEETVCSEFAVLQF